MPLVMIDHTSIPPQLPDSVCCVGYFDGLHKGHQLLFEKTFQIAKKKHLSSGVILFDPDPWTLFHPDVAMDHLTPLEKRLSMLTELGFQQIYVLQFTKSFAALSIKEFHDLLYKMNVKFLICGKDFHYAAKNSGDYISLKEDGRFEVIGLDPYMETANQKISSSTIESYIKQGKIAQANQLLGHMYSIDGIVEKGYQRGTKLLKIPTANLSFPGDQVIPRIGVYAGYVRIDKKYYWAMINIGNNPTFGNQKETIEAHILDFNQDIYGKKIRMLFADFIRPEQKFDSIDALKAQLHKDIDTTKKILSKKSMKDWCFDKTLL